MRIAQHILLAFMLMLILIVARQPSQAAGPNTSTYLPLIIAQKASTGATSTSTATATDTSIPNTTSTATATLTSTATSTRPPSCFETAGTYPIGVDANLLDENGFINPDMVYQQAPYQGKFMKRITLRETNTPGNFIWLRWRADPSSNSSSTLIAALTAPGTLSQGFDEAPWPHTTNLTEPSGYPDIPKQLSPGDWMYTSSGLSNTLAETLNILITNQTLLRLPLYDEATGDNSSAVAHVLRPAIFILTSYGYSSQEGWYIDLVYIGDSALVGCNP